MSLPKTNHPWRRGRSASFANHVAKLPREEREKIEAAEQEYVLKTSGFNDPRRSAERDYGACFLGVDESKSKKYIGRSG